MKILAIMCICMFSLTSCGQADKKKNISKKYKYTNKLINESSPYLLEHAHNPVNWYPWGKEALEKAKKEHKLVIVSIGYSACHWCHVMEHDSFEDEKVAKFMNDNFVSIKVDREERPDIDQIYMNAVQLLTGRGGWPLNCVILPDGRPIYGGTFFPKKQWVDMLSKIVDLAKKNPKKIEEQAKLVTNGVQHSEIIHLNTKKELFTLNDVNTVFTNWKNDIDYTNGGEKRTPKFPLPIGYQFLLQYNYVTKNKDALKAVTTTLNKMGNGGIYDQIGGGFSRYSTDAYWKIPHFEKMLYDNSQLVSLYSMAYQKTKDANYKNIVNETLHFIQRDLTSKEGSFYSSLDADSEGEEGKFYVWTKKEIEKIVGNEANLVLEYYNITEKGNWEHGKNIMFKSTSDKKIAHKYKISELELTKRILKAKHLLLKERLKRVKPKRDDKIITSWNALMLKAYVDAYRVFDNKEYLKSALKSALFINTKIKSSDGKLYRNYKNGKASINGFLDDYSFTIQAFISLYQATFNEKWLLEAQQLTNYAITHFYNKKNGMFYYTSDVDSPLIARKTEVPDNVIPSSNSQMAKNLFILGHYFYNDDYIQKAKKMLNNVKKSTENGKTYYANWDILMMWFVNKPYEVAIVGENFEDKRKEFDQHYIPNVFLSGGKNEGMLSLLKNKLVEGKTTIYVCQNKVCKMPVTKVKEALKEIEINTNMNN